MVICAPVHIISVFCIPPLRGAPVRHGDRHPDDDRLSISHPPVKLLRRTPCYVVRPQGTPRIGEITVRRCHNGACPAYDPSFCKRIADKIFIHIRTVQSAVRPVISVCRCCRQILRRHNRLIRRISVIVDRHSKRCDLASCGELGHLVYNREILDLSGCHLLLRLRSLGRCRLLRFRVLD